MVLGVFSCAFFPSKKLMRSCSRGGRCCCCEAETPARRYNYSVFSVGDRKRKCKIYTNYMRAKQTTAEVMYNCQIG